MAFDVTAQARGESERLSKKPNIVLEIDGISTAFGALTIKKLVRIGDPGLEIGNDWTIGGFTELEDQNAFISYDAGTTSNITQSLNPDKGTGETVVRFQAALIDKNQTITNILAPGNVVEDILGRKAKIWFGFENSAYKKDYIIIMRGIIDDFDAGAGIVTLKLSSPDQLKRQTIFIAHETELTSGMGAGDTLANVIDTSDFLAPITGPDGSIDDDLKLYVRINDELMRYEAKSPTQFQTLSRGQLGTAADSHNSGDTVTAFYRLGPNDVMTLALKTLLGGKNGFYEEDVEIDNFVRITGTDTVDNAIFIKDLDVEQEFNLVIGDYGTTTGAANGANNFSSKQVIGITVDELGSTIVFDDVSLVEEISTAATISFRSQFDVWPAGAGLALDNDFVDIKQHLDIRSNFLSSSEMDIYIDEEIEAKKFITDEIYNPVSCFSIPRKAQASVGIHRPPIPGVTLKELNSSTVLNASKLKLKRSISKNFFNSIIYKYEADPLDTGIFERGLVRTNATSLSRIPIGNKSLIIESRGLREVLSAGLIANEAAARRLNKYKFGAEFIDRVETNVRTGFDVEIGDAIILDFESLQLSDSQTGSRKGEPKLYEIVNKRFNTKTGVISLDIVDTNVDKDIRFGLISPSSKIQTGISTNQFIIKPSFNTDEFGVNEYRKWDRLHTASVVVRSEDYSIFDTALIQNFSGNTVTLQTPLSFVPSANYIMELDIYDNQPAEVKLIYVFMSDAVFADGGAQYAMI